MSRMNTEAGNEKQWVAMTSIIAALLLTGTKLAVGIVSGSLGVLSEAAHSGLDLLAAGMTYFAVRISDKEADARHAYGHGKIENLSALFETMLLLVTCIWIIYEAGNRLLGAKQVHVDAGIWTFLVIILSICIDIGRSRALMRAARKHNSQALEADAVHFSTDIWSSLVVLLGLLCVWLSGKLELPWLMKADSVAALCVAVIVSGVCLKLGKKSIHDLIDAIPQGVQESIHAIAINHQGIIEVKRIRVRSCGADLFGDMVITVSSEMGVKESHFVADEIETTVKVVYPNMDITVHVEPGTNVA